MGYGTVQEPATYVKSLDQESVTFSVKVSTQHTQHIVTAVNIFGFADHMISILTTHLCTLYHEHSYRQCEWAYLHSNKTL